MMGYGLWQGTTPVEKYRFPGMWSLHLYPYEAEVIVDGCMLPIHSGFASMVAPDCSIEYHYKRPWCASLRAFDAGTPFWCHSNKSDAGHVIGV